MNIHEWTHKALVRRMANWLKNSKRHTVVMSEFCSTKITETPDVVGWIGRASSTLIECKISKTDFLADAKKIFRREEEWGIGDFRYMACPSELIKPEDLSDGWGLLYVGEYHVTEIVKAELKQANKANECSMLMSALRRLEISTAVYVVSEPNSEITKEQQ